MLSVALQRTGRIRTIVYHHDRFQFLLQQGAVLWVKIDELLPFLPHLQRRKIATYRTTTVLAQHFHAMIYLWIICHRSACNDHHVSITTRGQLYRKPPEAHQTP